MQVSDIVDILKAREYLYLTYMSETLIEGIWWFAGTEDKVPGTLICNDNEWNLALNGCFSEQTDEDIKRAMSGGKPGFIFPDTERTILGITKDGRPITLEYFATKGSTFILNGNGYNSETYPVKRYYENVHFPDPKQVNFTKLFITIPYLFEWLGENLIEFERQTGGGGSSLGMKIMCRVAKDTAICTLGNIQLSLSPFVQVPVPIIPSKQYCIKLDTHLILESTTTAEISLWDFKTAAFAFRNLLTLAMGLDIPIQSVIAFTDTNTEKRPNRSPFRPEVLIHDRFIQPDSVPFKRIRPDQITFTYADIIPNAAAIINKWFDMSKQLEDVFNIYFQTINNSHLNFRNKFLSIITALEGFFRNDPGRVGANLKEVLTAMHDKVKPFGRLLALDEIQLVVNTRDKLTHIELSDPSRPIFDDYRIFEMVPKLTALFELSLLLELGLDQVALDRIAKEKIFTAKQ